MAAAIQVKTAPPCPPPPPPPKRFNHCCSLQGFSLERGDPDKGDTPQVDRSVFYPLDPYDSQESKRTVIAWTVSLLILEAEP